MYLCTVSSDLIVDRRPFVLIKGSRSIDPVDYLLYNQCKVNLNEEYTDKANGPQFIWPYCYWSILICEEIHLEITVIGIIGLGGFTSAFGFYLYSTRQVYIHRLRFPDK